MSILITKDTTCVIQGITGREAVSMTRECLDYGTKIVGGVTPGRGGREVHGVPVFDTLEEIARKTRVDASVISVPAAFAGDTAVEATEHGVRLIGNVTENIPRSRSRRWWSSPARGASSPNCLACSPGEARSAGWAARGRRAGVHQGRVESCRSGG
jgi:succinyl-CoA synthetase alpha subunit